MNGSWTYTGTGRAPKQNYKKPEGAGWTTVSPTFGNENNYKFSLDKEGYFSCKVSDGTTFYFTTTEGLWKDSDGFPVYIFVSTPNKNDSLRFKYTDKGYLQVIGNSLFVNYVVGTTGLGKFETEEGGVKHMRYYLTIYNLTGGAPIFSFKSPGYKPSVYGAAAISKKEAIDIIKTATRDMRRK